MRLFSSLFAVLLLTLALPAVASAPIITITLLAAFVIPSGPDGCPSFDVYVAPQAGRPNNGKTITFANGSTIGHGATFVTATNLTTNKSINLNISGPAQFSVTDNTFTAFGAILGFLPPNLVPPDLPAISFAHGKIVLQFDNAGNIVSITFTGTAQNICELLQ